MIGDIKGNPGPPSPAVLAAELEEVSLVRGYCCSAGRNQHWLYSSMWKQLRVFSQYLWHEKRGLLVVVLIPDVSLPQIANCKKSWEEADLQISPTLLAHLAQLKVNFANWRKLSRGDRLEEIGEFKKAFEATEDGLKWAQGWTTTLKSAGGQQLLLFDE